MFFGQTKTCLFLGWPNPSRPNQPKRDNFWNGRQCILLLFIRYGYIVRYETNLSEEQEIWCQRMPISYLSYFQFFSDLPAPKINVWAFFLCFLSFIPYLYDFSIQKSPDIKILSTFNHCILLFSIIWMPQSLIDQFGSVLLFMGSKISLV